MPPLVIGGAIYGVGELMAGTAFVGSAVGSGVVVGKALASHSTNQSTPAEKAEQAKEGAKEDLSSEEDAQQGCAGCDEKPPERTNDPIKNKDKLQRQMKQRGWTQEQIDDAVKNGEQVPATNFQTGGPATRYINPSSGQSVIIDNNSGGIIHVGGPGFKY